MDREPSILEAKILRCLGCLKLSIKGALESEKFTIRSLLQSEYLCEFREMNTHTHTHKLHQQVCVYSTHPIDPYGLDKRYI